MPRASSTKRASTSTPWSTPTSSTCNGTEASLRSPAQHLQPPAPPVAPQRVAGVGDVAQLVQHEAGHHQRAVDEPRDRQVGDASVYDGRGIHQDGAVTLLRQRRDVRPAGQERRGGIGSGRAVLSGGRPRGGAPCGIQAGQDGANIPPRAAYPTAAPPTAKDRADANRRHPVQNAVQGRIGGMDTSAATASPTSSPATPGNQSRAGHLGNSACQDNAAMRRETAGRQAHGGKDQPPKAVTRLVERTSPKQC